MSFEEIAVDVRNLSKRYEIYATPRDRLKQLVLPRLYRGTSRIVAALGGHPAVAPPHYFREFWALRNVSFQVRRGETFGIIGRNGSGKSTLLQILAGVLSPTNGEYGITGRVAALLELGSGFDPEFTGRENVFLNGRILGLSQKQIEARYDQIVQFADIGEFIDEPVKTYSSGMFVRLAFAVQAHIDAAVVIIDEALAVGDVFFRQKCYTRLEQLKESGAAILLVSHSMPDIEQYCERAILLDHGKQRFIGPSSEAAKHYYLVHQAESVNKHEQAVDLDHGMSDQFSLHAIVRPPQDAFVDLTDKSQITDGRARCVGVALCNMAGEPCFSFQQGDRAVFYSEYEVVEGSGVPVCGVVIKNDRGVIVHGKNSLQVESDVSACSGSRCRVVCRHEISLNLAQGDYVFEVGMAMVSMSQWSNRASISHEEMSALYDVVCQVANTGHFSIGLRIRNGVATLTHHGISDLPGEIETAVVALA